MFILLVAIAVLYIVDMYLFVRLLLFGSTGSLRPAYRGGRAPKAGSHQWQQWKTPSMMALWRGLKKD